MVNIYKMNINKIHKKPLKTYSHTNDVNKHVII